MAKHQMYVFVSVFMISYEQQPTPIGVEDSFSVNDIYVLYVHKGSPFKNMNSLLALHDVYSA